MDQNYKPDQKTRLFKEMKSVEQITRYLKLQKLVQFQLASSIHLLHFGEHHELSHNKAMELNVNLKREEFNNTTQILAFALSSQSVRDAFYKSLHVHINV